MTFQFVKTKLGADPIIVEGYVAASPNAVFRAWTDPERVMKWFGPQPRSLLSADINLQVGGIWRFVMRKDQSGSMGFEGEYLMIDPDCRLVMKWSKFTVPSKGPSEAHPVSQVDIILSPKGAGTDIRIVHSAIADKDRFYQWLGARNKEPARYVWWPRLLKADIGISATKGSFVLHG